MPNFTKAVDWVTGSLRGVFPGVSSELFWRYNFGLVVLTPLASFRGLQRGQDGSFG